MKKILNLGCGDEMFGTHRVDIRETKATTCVADVEKRLPFPDEYFDMVYEKNLLEHLRNVGVHLEECFRVLKKGGKLMIITDNAACTRFYALGTHEGRYEKKHKNPKDRHYSIFTRAHIKNHLAHLGFHIQFIGLIATDTFGGIIDKVTGQLPRIKVVAMKPENSKVYIQEGEPRRVKLTLK